VWGWGVVVLVEGKRDALSSMLRSFDVILIWSILSHTPYLAYYATEYSPDCAISVSRGVTSEGQSALATKQLGEKLESYEHPRGTFHSVVLGSDSYLIPRITSAVIRRMIRV